MTILQGRTHFIGIGGAGMSAIATILLESGYPVSGSDLKESDTVSRLREAGAHIFIGHKAGNIPEGTDTVVVSTAIPADNPELQAAKEQGIAIVHRGEMLSKLMSRQKGIAVAGAHGKTTTTAMLSVVLSELNMDPTVMVGGHLSTFGSNARLGKGEYLVAEADESDGSFLKLEPFITVVTNVEDDHMDHYGSLEKIHQAFRRFIAQTSPQGFAVLCSDDPFLERTAAEASVPVVTYGLNDQADFCARNITANGGITADVWYREELLGVLALSVPGRHNLLDALATAATAHRLGLPFHLVAAALAKFTGVNRRFQTIGRGPGLWIVDDYAHHPTEIAATIKAAKESNARRVIAVFQPHRYSRTRQLYREFGQSFAEADMVILDEIYSAGEPPIEGVTSNLIYKELAKHREAYFVPGREAILDFLQQRVEPGDLVITLGAGDIWQVAEQLAARLGLSGG